MGDVKTFGQRLKELREARKLSQTDLAGDDLSSSYISLLESGKRTASDEVVRKLAVRLGCSPSQLADGQSTQFDDKIDLVLRFAMLAIEHGEAADARVRLQDALLERGLSQQVRDELTYHLGRSLERLGDYVGAIRAWLPLFERAERPDGDCYLPVHVLGLHLCGAYFDVSDFAQAAVIGERGLVAARERQLAGTTDYFRLAATVFSVYMERGDFAHARVWGEILLEEARADGGRSGQSAIYWNLAVLAEAQGRVGEARQLCEQALLHLSELGNSRDFARLRLQLANILLADDPPAVEEAIDLLRRCAEDLADLGSKSEMAVWHWAMSIALLHRAQDLFGPEDPADLLNAEFEARAALSQASGSPDLQADAWLALAYAMRAQGRESDASYALEEAHAAMRLAPDSRSQALDWRELGESLAAEGNLADASAAFRRALDAVGVRDRSRPTREKVARLMARRVESRSLRPEPRRPEL